MSVLRALVVLVVSILPSFGATFGTLVPHAQPLADLAVDDARRRLYVVSTAANQVEVYNTAVSPPRLTNTIRTDLTPLAVAIARSGRSLYVACYGSSSLVVIDLTSTTFASRSVTLPAPPQGVAVGFNEKVLISTIGTRTGQGVLLTYDPSTIATLALQSIVIAPTPPAVPALPPPNGLMALAARGILRASPDGRTIVGMHNLANNTNTVFVFDVNSSTVLGSRNLGPISPVLAVSPDGSRFMAGSILFESSTMLVLAQQSAVNSPHVFPTGANFTVQTTQGGAVFAQLASGAALLAAYNIVPVLSPAARANTSQLLINSPDNLLIRMGIQLPESLSGKMVITADNSTIYADLAIRIHRAAHRRAGAVSARYAGCQRRAPGDGSVRRHRGRKFGRDSGAQCRRRPAHRHRAGAGHRRPPRPPCAPPRDPTAAMSPPPSARRPRAPSALPLPIRC